MDKKCNSILLATDLSAAFDTIDHCILLKKLEFYGIRGKSLKLMESFLSDRKTYVNIDTFSSNMIEQGPWSCIQGSKLSGLLYTLYTNEIPEVKKLMQQPENYKKITRKPLPKKYNNTHTTINYVDDSTHIISFTEILQIKDYIEAFYDVLHIIYEANLLKVNSDKTKAMLFLTHKSNIDISNFTFMAKNDIIYPKN